MPKPECRKNGEAPMTKRTTAGFGLRHLDFLRHSYFGFRHLPMALLLLAGLWPMRTITAEPVPLSIAWDKNFLTVRGPNIPGEEVRIHYLEAYCRAGSTDADWRLHTV